MRHFPIKYGSLLSAYSDHAHKHIKTILRKGHALIPTQAGYKCVPK